MMIVVVSEVGLLTSLNRFDGCHGNYSNHPDGHRGRPYSRPDGDCLHNLRDDRHGSRLDGCYGSYDRYYRSFSRN